MRTSRIPTSRDPSHPTWRPVPELRRSVGWSQFPPTDPTPLAGGPIGPSPPRHPKSEASGKVSGRVRGRLKADADRPRHRDPPERAAGLSNQRSNSMTMLQRFTYTLEEACDLLGISRGSAYYLVRTGQIPALRM